MGLEIYFGVRYYFTYNFAWICLLHHLEVMMQVSEGGSMVEIQW